MCHTGPWQQEPQDHPLWSVSEELLLPLRSRGILWPFNYPTRAYWPLIFKTGSSMCLPESPQPLTEPGTQHHQHISGLVPFHSPPLPGFEAKPRPATELSVFSRWHQPAVVEVVGRGSQSPAGLHSREFTLSTPAGPKCLQGGTRID